MRLVKLYLELLVNKQISSGFLLETRFCAPLVFEVCYWSFLTLYFLPATLKVFNSKVLQRLLKLLNSRLPL